MASSPKLTVVERCPISPPPCSVPPVTLPLTFFDIPWLLFSPNQPLFFYRLPTSTTHFTQTILPKLKQTLSLTLQHFFPLAGKLVTPVDVLSTALHIEYTEDHSILLTTAEAPPGSFKNLVGYHLKASCDFDGLVPTLTAAVGSKQPLLAIQITVFPDTGISIGFTLQNVVADWRTFKNFLRAWASLSKTGGVLEDERHVAFHDRSVMIDPSGLRSTFLKEWWKLKNIDKEVKDGSDYDMVRATFVLGPKELETIRKRILTRSNKLFWLTKLYLSPYTITCALIWVCWTKMYCSKNKALDGDDVHYFGYTAGGLPRIPYTVPSTYVGNCVGFGRASATRRELIGENSVVFAADAIGDKIVKVNEAMMDEAENWISEWKMIRESSRHVMVTGSPKLGLYELDFGWGRPVKIEEASINNTGAIFVADTREVTGGIEVGVALTKSMMEVFTTMFNKELKSILDSE